MSKYIYENVDKDMIKLRNDIQKLVDTFKEKHGGKIELSVENIDVTNISSEFEEFITQVSLSWHRTKIGCDISLRTR